MKQRRAVKSLGFTVPSVVRPKLGALHLAITPYVLYTKARDSRTLYVGWRMNGRKDADRVEAVNTPILEFEVEIQETMDRFRRVFEEAVGPTDWTRAYVCHLPLPVQEKLLREDPAAYFDNLPPYLSAFFKAVCQSYSRKGRLDDLPVSFIKAIMRNGEVGSPADQDTTSS